MAKTPGDVTALLREVSGGDRRAMDALVTALYGDLHEMAMRHLRRERRDHTLQTTALVHDVYCKLLSQHEVSWRDRAHFFGVAAQLIRRILIDHARGRGRQRRGEGRQHLRIDEVEVAMQGTGVDLLELDDALRRLADVREVQARVVELRFFGGLTIEEVAAVLGIGKRTVDREWLAAKAWLYRELANAEES